MWYFAWVLGLAAALAIGVICALRFEAAHAADEARKN